MGTLNLRNVPPDLRNKFKAACAAKGKNMTEVIVEYMKREVEKRQPKK
jgi:hypothetical protein